ncbi:hypothetical protein J8M14_08520 [Aquimarina sp. MMG016]|nr:hypothetical protein [Aquimarina sp. MMG016]
MLVFFVIAHNKIGFEFNRSYVLLFSGGLVVYVLSMLLLNYITQRNDLTQKSTHTVLLFAFLTTLIPNALTDFWIVLSNIFVLLAVMRILGLRNGKQVKSKILDASICVGIASLAYFWSIGFLVFVFLGVLFFEPKNYRNWIIPIIGLLIVFLFSNCFTLLFYDSFFSIPEYTDPISFSFDNYIENQQLFSFGTLSICIVFFFSIYLITFKRHSAKVKPVLNLIIAQLLIAAAIVIISPAKNTSELFFVTSPLAIIGTTYLELEYSKLVKEFNIWVFLLLPFTILLF